MHQEKLADNMISMAEGVSDTEKVTGVLQLDDGLTIVGLDAAAGELLGTDSVNLLGRRVGEVSGLVMLVNLMHSGISFSNQIIRVGERHIACDYVPRIEGGRVAGGVLTLVSGFSQEAAAMADELSGLLRSAGAFMDYDGIIILNRAGVVVMVNQAFADVLDTTPQAMIGKHVHDAYPNSQPSRMPLIMETGKPEIGVTHYMNGREVITNRFPLIKDGKVIGAMGKIIFRDVREMTLLANRLQSAPERAASTKQMAGKGALFKYDIDSIVGQSIGMQALKKTLVRVASKNSNVLLRGESGTGKELFAHAIHAASARRYSSFIKVNCAAIPEHLLESELFGYAEGAFTGAKKGGQVGKFELAHTGTIFLDEIGDMPLAMQAKLLRVLQEKELIQLGSSVAKTVDVRVVAATNCNLEQLVKEGKFREDLYYRLNVVTLAIPPLRERCEDIYCITKSIIDQLNDEFGLAVEGLNAEAWNILRQYSWPGNIRELRNVLESAFNVVDGSQVRAEHLPRQLSHGLAASTAKKGDEGLEEYVDANLGRLNIAEIMTELERIVISKALERCHNNKLHAAQLLGISRPGLYKKLNKCSFEETDNC